MVRPEIESVAERRESGWRSRLRADETVASVLGADDVPGMLKPCLAAPSK
jgi:hypothetical protein